MLNLNYCNNNNNIEINVCRGVWRWKNAMWAFRSLCLVTAKLWVRTAHKWSSLLICIACSLMRIPTTLAVKWETGLDGWLPLSVTFNRTEAVILSAGENGDVCIVSRNVFRNISRGSCVPCKMGTQDFHRIINLSSPMTETPCLDTTSNKQLCWWQTTSEESDKS